MLHIFHCKNCNAEIRAYCFEEINYTEKGREQRRRQLDAMLCEDCFGESPRDRTDAGSVLQHAYRKHHDASRRTEKGAVMEKRAIKKNMFFPDATIFHVEPAVKFTGNSEEGIREADDVLELVAAMQPPHRVTKFWFAPPMFRDFQMKLTGKNGYHHYRDIPLFVGPHIIDRALVAEIEPVK